MEKSEFIKCFGAMRTVFDAVSAAASSLMEMNAMNVSPTEEESVRLQSVFEEITGHIRRLKTDAEDKVREYSVKKEESAAISQGITEEYTKMQERLLLLEKENADARIKWVQKGAEKEEFERKCRESEAELEDIVRRRDAEVEKTRKKRKELQKWFWVPGYGIYLAIDTLVNEFNNKISSLNARLERERSHRDDLEREYHAASCEMEKRKLEMESIRGRIEKQLAQAEHLNAKIRDYKAQLLCWEDFYMQMSRLEAKLKAGTNSPDMLYEVVELMEAFGNAAEE